MNDAERKFIQSILDAITPHLFKGNTMVITLKTVMDCPENFSAVLFGIAKACPETEREKLLLRSGRCLPMGRHAGEKEKANAEAKKAQPTNVIQMPAPKKQEFGYLVKAAMHYLNQKGSLTSPGLASLAKVSGHNAANVLWRLHKKGLIERSGNEGSYSYTAKGQVKEVGQ
jgi:hypothetical protein